MAIYKVGYDDVFGSFVFEWAAGFGADSILRSNDLYDYCETHDENPFRMKRWGNSPSGAELYIGRYTVPNVVSLCVSAAIDKAAATVIFVALSADSSGDDWDMAGRLAARHIG
ncbi:hypothetical protein [Xanthomonas oryzae]|uniref:hypothetical protein n=1 Tax=Xanthomonas oryzae TaxID=347 RepID=UPI002DE259FA|nr:hypothetical protein [Xanthomonas oryzae pv. oryzicola]MEC5113824.1 hypothetical protein [Xanthomonas oryzae pv. oryzicola]